MKKVARNVFTACVSATVIGSLAIVAHAAQTTTGWGKYVDFWTDTLSTGIVEQDNDSVSHVTWTGKEVNGDFNLKFTIQSMDNVDVCDQTYVNSATDLGIVKTITSSCIKDRAYNLVAARENIFDPAVYCSGNWEP